MVSQFTQALMRGRVAPAAGGAAPTVLGAGPSDSINNSTTVNLTVPTGTVEGCTLFAIVGAPDAGTISGPAGWTVVAGTGFTGIWVGLTAYQKTASAADQSGAGSATYAFTTSGSTTKICGGIIAVSANGGINVGNGQDASGFDTSVDCPALVTTVANTLVITGYSINNNGRLPVAPFPNSATERVNANVGGAGSDIATFAFSYVQAAAGSTGSLTLTIDGNARGQTLAFAVAPA